VTKEAQHSIEKILGSYFSKKEISEYRKLLKGETLKADLVSSLTNLNKEQLSSVFPSGSEFQYKVNLLITFAKDKLKEISFAEFLVHVANISVIQGEFSSAEQIIDILSKLVGKREDLNSFYAHGLYLLASVYSRQADWKKSISILNKAKRLFEKEKDFRGYVRCENLLGVIHLDYGKLFKAEKHFQNCLAYLNITSDTNLMGMIEINLGVVNGMKGSYEEAYNYFHRALIKFNKLKNIIRIVELRHNLALLHTHKHEYKLALGEIDQSITFANRLNYLSNLAISYLAKAFIYIQLNDLSLANAFSDKSLELSYKLDDRLSVADNFKLKGIIEREGGNLLLAETHFLTSLRINEELENILNHAETSLELGILYKKMNKNEEAVKYLNSSLNYYKSIKHTAQINYIKNLIRNR
jgi:tetratricopeptide (TPR) repeat protein